MTLVFPQGLIVLEVNQAYEVSQNFFWAQDHTYSGLQAIDYQRSTGERFTPLVHMSISNTPKLGNFSFYLIYSPVAGLCMSKSVYLW